MMAMVTVMMTMTMMNSIKKTVPSDTPVKITKQIINNSLPRSRCLPLLRLVFSQKGPHWLSPSLCELKLYTYMQFTYISYTAIVGSGYHTLSLVRFIFASKKYDMSVVKKVFF